MNTLDGKKVLVAGGAGFLGSYICRALLQAGAQVTVLDILPREKIYNLQDIESDVNIITGSVTDEKCVFNSVQGQNAVVDASFPLAKCDPGPGRQYIEVGTLGVYNLLKAVLHTGANLVFSSSISVYGVQNYTPINEKHPTEPILLYGATKLAGENYCKIMQQRYGCNVVILRYSDLYGPGLGRNGAPAAFLSKVLAKKPLLIRGGGKQIRSYLYISDAGEAVVAALKCFKQGGVFNIAGKKAISIIELAQIVRRATGVSVPIEYISDSETDKRHYSIDGTLAEKEIGFYPRVDFEEGLSLTFEWLKGRSK